MTERTNVRTWRGALRRALCLLAVGGLSIIALSQPCPAAAPAAQEIAAEGPSAPAASPESIDLAGVWKFRTDPGETGLAEKWHQPDYDDSAWRSLHVPSSWEDQGIATGNPQYPSTEPEDGYNGYAWYRRHFTVPAGWAQSKVTLRIGAIEDMDATYINGRLVGSTTQEENWGEAREYLLPPDALKPGEDNIIAIRVCDFGGPGGISGEPVALAIGPAAPAPVEEEPESPVYTVTRTDMVRIGGSVHVPADTRVEGDVVAIGGSVTVDGYVQGDAVSVGGSVEAKPGAKIDGDAVAIGGSAIIDESASVGGDVIETPFLPQSLRDRIMRNYDIAPSWLKQWAPREEGVLARAMAVLGMILVALIIPLLSALLFPRRLEIMAKALPTQPGLTALLGVAGFLLTPAGLTALVIAAAFVTVLLAITIVGIIAIPAVWAVAAVAVVGFGIALLLGGSAIGLSLGRAILAKLGRTDVGLLPATLLGAAVILLISFVPRIGVLVGMTVFIFAYGVVIATGVGASPDWIRRRRRAGPAAPAAPEAPPAPGQPTDQPPVQAEAVESPPVEGPSTPPQDTSGDGTAEGRPSEG